MATSKKPARKRTLLDRLRERVTDARTERVERETGLKLRPAKKAATRRTSRFGEPDEMTEAQKARVRAARKAARKRT